MHIYTTLSDEGRELATICSVRFAHLSESALDMALEEIKIVVDGYQNRFPDTPLSIAIAIGELMNRSYSQVYESPRTTDEEKGPIRPSLHRGCGRIRPSLRAEIYLKLWYRSWGQANMLHDMLAKQSSNRMRSCGRISAGLASGQVEGVWRPAPPPRTPPCAPGGNTDSVW